MYLCMGSKLSFQPTLYHPLILDVLLISDIWFNVPATVGIILTTSRGTFRENKASETIDRIVIKICSLFDAHF